VSSVESAASGEAGSALNVTFDRLVSGKAESELHTVVSAVLSAPSRMPPPEPPMAAPPPPAAPPPSSSSSGGGLLGGVTSTVGSTVNSTAGVAGDTLGGVAGTASTVTHGAAGAAAGLATPIKAIHIDSRSEGQASADSRTSSSLSTREGRLRMESGTRLEMRVVSDSDASARR